MQKVKNSPASHTAERKYILRTGRDAWAVREIACKKGLKRERIRSTGRRSLRSFHKIEREWMQACVPARGLPLEWRKAILFCAVVFSFTVIPVRAQDVAEAARQEKARKAAEQKSTPHVYTDEDLKKKVILTPEDQARVEARKQQQTPAPAQQNAEQLPSNADPNAESLGEIARRFRAEKAEHDAEVEARKKFTAFPYQIPDDVLAEPKSEADPLIAPEAGPAMIAPPSPAPVRHYTLRTSTQPTSRGRISPFQPRPVTNTPPAPPAAILVVPGFPEGGPVAPRVGEKTLPVPAVSAGTRVIEVQAGQSWWKLAELYLGDGARWPELRKLNSSANSSPELLKRGSKVLVPESLHKTEAVSHSVPLQKGDSLWSLAQEHLGRGNAWVCLATANPQITDYTHIAIGTIVRLPAGNELASCGNRNASQAKR
jgi:nucleoid-associated protein YgaU